MTMPLIESCEMCLIGKTRTRNSQIVFHLHRRRLIVRGGYLIGRKGVCMIRYVGCAQVTPEVTGTGCSGGEKAARKRRIFNPQLKI